MCVCVCVCVCVCARVVAHSLFNRTFAFCILFVGLWMITHKTLPPILLQPIYYVSLLSFHLKPFYFFSSTRFFILPLHTFRTFFTPHQRVSNPTIKQNHLKLTLMLWPIQAVSRQVSPRKPRFIPRHSMWNYWTKWAWDWFLSEHFILTCQLFFQDLATYIWP